MKKILLLSFLLCLSTFGFSQFFGKAPQPYSKQECIYGTLSGEEGYYTGYFWFEREITQRGQRILFKKEKGAKKKEVFYADGFDLFVSDSTDLYMKTFPIIHTVTGDVSAMIPRVVSGRIELYNCRYQGYYSFAVTDHFFVLSGWDKLRLRKKDFIEQMKSLVGADTELMRRIESKELKYDDLPQIIDTFNKSR